MSKYRRARTKELDRLLTKETLERLYWQDNHTIRGIADLYQCSVCAVFTRMVRHGIQRRPYGTWARAKSVPLDPNEVQALTGEILGDGCIHLPSGCVTPIYIQTAKYREFLEFVQAEMPHLMDGRPITPTKKGIYRGYRIESWANPVLHEWRTNWYPFGRKELPADVQLSPRTCLHWYLGDGSRHLRTGVLRLFAHAFSRERVEAVLLPQLKAFHASIAPSERPTVKIPRRFAADFFDYIGPCPVAPYQYKWGN